MLWGLFKSMEYMFGIENFMIFISTAILLNLYPGPDSLYIIGRSISQGRAAGIIATLGISSGSLFHTFMGAAGLSVLILSSENAFMIIKYAGATYLFYQAINMLKDSIINNISNNLTVTKKSLFKIYKQGILTNILNPKVALFFMALLPQFISETSTSKALTFIVLGLIFILTGTLWCLILAIFSSYFSQRLRNNSSISKWMLRANAGLFTYLGVKLATD